MAVTHDRVSVTDSATLLSDASNDRAGHSVLVQNVTATTVYLGGEGVTDSDYGVALTQNSDVSIDLQQGEKLYGIVTTGSVTLNVLRAGN